MYLKHNRIFRSHKSKDNNEVTKKRQREITMVHKTIQKNWKIKQLKIPGLNSGTSRSCRVKCYVIINERGQN